MRTPPTEILELLSQGREAYLRQQWDVALRFDQNALDLATVAQEAWLTALCHRFVGLCHYRRGGAEALGRSEDYLRRALDLAHRSEAKELRLAVSNHLGATLRDLGRHDEAYDVFREALREAVGPSLVGVRARLLGNLGALFDELDQRASADDCYARYEELLENLGDPRRLANGRALAGRAALLRGDLEGAAWRFAEELRAGEEFDDRRRRCSAKKHRAELAIAHLDRASGGDQREVERLSGKAEEALDAAWAESDERDDRKVRVRIALKRAELYRRRGRIADADAALREVGPMAEALDHPVLTPKLYQLRARVCADAGLHGEAFWYLERATRRRVDVIEGLKSDRVRAMAAAWVEELRALANELRAEAFLLPRGQAERDEFDVLLERIKAILGPDVGPVATAVAVDPWEWHDRLRGQSQRRWERIMGDAFERLHPESQADLVRSEITYHGAVDDLGRSAHLLAITLERELRERVLTPLRRVAQANGHDFKPKSEWALLLKPMKEPTLSTLLLVMELAGRPGAARACIERVVDGPILDALALVASAARAIAPVSGTPFSLVEVRNAVAHGRTETTLERVAVDAIKRALALDAPAMLGRFLVLPLSS